MKNFSRNIVKAIISIVFLALVLPSAQSKELPPPGPVSEQEWQISGLDERLTNTVQSVVSNGVSAASAPVFGSVPLSRQFMAMAANITGPVTPSVGLSSGIAELADALGGDVSVMSKWIHDNIDYVPYYGLMQGAEQTLLNRSGNDADQAALLVEMAKAAGHQAAYMIGQIWVPKANVPNWIGAKDIDEALHAFLIGGYAYPQQITTTADSLNVLHIFPMIDEGDGWYFYFPAVKGYKHKTQKDIESLVGYNRSSLLSAVGGTVNSDSAVGLDYDALNTHLTGLTTGLVSSLKQNYPNAAEDILMGRRKIDPNDSYSFNYGQISAYYDLPDAYRHKVIINAGGTVITYDEPDIGCDKVYFKYNGNLFSRHFDGYASESFIEPGLTEIEIISEKPYAAQGSSFADSTNTYPIAAGGIYVLTKGYVGSASGGGSDYYSKRLNMMLQDESFDAEAKVSESLALAGEIFMQETAAMQQILDGSTGSRRIVHCRTGLIGQEAGYYIDIKNQLGSSFEAYPTSDDSSGIMPYMMLFSGLEHAVLEQTQSPEKEAVSTVRILKLANESSNPVYRLNSSNFSAVRPQLNGYSTAKLDAFQVTVNDGGSVILPKNANVVLNDWTGEGYIEHYFSGTTEGMFMAIGGGYNGGFGSNEGQYDFWQLYTNESARDFQNSHTPTFTAADPVDMTTGAYVFDHTDFSMQGPLPLSLSRHYSSHSNLQDGPMGYGWTHSFNIRAQEHSGYEAGLGLRTPEDAAAAFVAATVIRDLVENDQSPKGWLTASLAVNWAMEQLTENAVSIYVGQRVTTFTKQPDGSYTPPPGMTASLIKTNDLYVMQERHGNRYEFDANLNLAEIEDPDGNTLAFAYNAQTNLQSVTNSFGPVFTFSYTGDLLTSVTDNSTPARTVSYQYDSDSNLTNFVDAAGFNWGVGYDSQHRVTWMKDPEQITTIQNFYNAIGQITNQTSASGNPWDFYFTGTRNVSEDPLGNQTAYYLDHKQRTWSVEQPDGSRSYTVFDGQNHPVQSITPNGVTNVVVYDVDHNVLAQTNAVGTPVEVATHYGYDGQHHLRFITNAVGTVDQTVSEMQYDAEHHVVKTIDPLGNETTMTYYPNGRLNQQTVFDGTSSDPALLAVQYTYDANGNPNMVSSTDAGSVDFDYNIRGALTHQTDAEENETTLSYDDRGLLLSTEYDDGSTVSQTYWKNGKLKTATDANGNTTTTYWNNAYKQAGVAFADGTSITNTYDSVDRLIASRDPEGYWKTNTLDEVGRVVAVSTALSSSSNQFDAVGNVISQTDAEERTTTYTYDALNRPVEVVYPNSTTNTFGYNALGKLIATTNLPGTSLERVTWNTFDVNGRLIATTNALGYSSTFEYNALGHPIRSVDALGHETRTGYDAQGRPVAVTNALGQVTQMSYDLNGNLETVTDALGRVTQHTYDELNRRTRTDYPDGSFTTSTFDDAGNVLTSTDVAGNTTSFGYNSMHRMVASTSTVDSASAVTSYTYNKNGQLLTSTDAEGNTTSYEYDALSRNVSVASTHSEITNQLDRVGNILQTIADPAGLGLWNVYQYDALNRTTNQQTSISSRQFAYDELGRQTKTTDPLSNEWHTEYNLLDHPVAETRPTGAREETDFDALGRRTRFVNADGKAVTFGLDALGRVTSITNALGKVTTFDFDAAGNLSERINANGDTTDYGYDDLNRLTTITNEGVEVATFDHDPNGNRVAHASPFASATFGYNEQNLLIASTQSVYSVSSVVQNQFDLNGNRTNIVYPGGLTVSYQFGADNRLEGVTTQLRLNNDQLGENTESFSFGYDTASRLTSIDYPNGINSTFDYDAESRVIGFSHGSFIERSIARDARGYKTSDDFNSGLEPTVIEGEQKITNNSADQITHIDQRDSWLGGELNQWYNRDYTYNDNGCLTAEEVSRPSWNTNALISEYSVDYTYDYDNRLVGADHNASNEKDVKYIYDASGARIGRINGYSDTGTWTTNYYVVDYTDGLKRPLAETDATGTITRYYVWSGSHLLCHIEADGTTRYYHADELGSTLALTDETGTVKAEYAYLPYGKRSSHTGEDTTPFQWLGGYGVYYDIDTDLHLTLYRAYSTVTKKFIQADPLGIDGGVNVYAWANLNPLFFIDPYGLSGLESAWNGVKEFGQGAWNGAKDIAQGIGTLVWNTGGSLGYGALGLTGNYELAEEIYGEQAQGMRDLVSGVGNLVWDTGGTVGYGYTSLFSPEKAEEIYGPQRDSFNQTVKLMTGGEDVSGSYRAGYIGTGLATWYMGGRLGQVANQPIGNLARGFTSTFDDAAYGMLDDVSGNTTLYRGVNSSHADFTTQSQGLVRPNNQSWQFWKGKGSTPYEHNAVQGGTLNSPYTSWTPDIRVADYWSKFVTGKGPTGSGVVLEANIPLRNQVLSPNLKQIPIKGVGAVSESEILIKGTVRATIRP